MGSSCSIVNDTEFDVWITHGVNWTVLTVTLLGVLSFVPVGGALAALGAGAGVGGALLRQGAQMMAQPMGNVAGLTAGNLVNVVTEVTASTLASALRISEEESERIQTQVRDFKNNAKLIKPGEKYTWSGTLSLTKTVYVMNEKLQFDQKGCFTGPTHGSENVYPISRDFQKLDVKKKPEDLITVYSK